MAHGTARRRIAFPTAELPPGASRALVVGRREIAVFNVDGELYALFNRCPHQQAPLLAGEIGGTALAGEVGELTWGREGEILRCPWHHYEYDLTTGRCLVGGDRMRVATYEVRREGDEIALYL